MIYVLLTLSLTFNFIFIIGLFIYFKYIKKYLKSFDFHFPLKTDDSIVDVKQAIDFYGDSIL